MRLYIINATWGGGGPGGIVADLYSVAQENGWTCRIAYSRGNCPKDVNSYHIGNALTPYIHAATSMIFDNAGFTTKKSTLNLIEDIEAFKPDVINLHNPLGYSMNLKILFEYFKKSAVKVVWTLHDVWSLTGHCHAEMCSHWESGCGNCPRKNEYPASYIFDKSRQNRILKEKIFGDVPNMRLITPSNWLRNLALKTYLKQYKIDVIHNGIDLEVFKPIDSELRKQYKLENKFVLLSVAGIWTKNKGAEYIYELTQRLDDRFAFVMIGKNKDRELKHNKRIIHIDRTDDRQQLAQWYTTADVFVNPTVGDNFPTVNLEAMACGTPVVTFDTGGCGEAVGNCGEVVPKGNIAEMIIALKKLYNKNIAMKFCINTANKYDKKEKYVEYLSFLRE